MTQDPGAPHSIDDDLPIDGDMHVDGCLCDVEIDASEMIADTDLPPASGGVGLVAVPPGDESDDVCGFDVADPTPDEDLPAAVGGVA